MAARSRYGQHHIRRWTTCSLPTFTIRPWRTTTNWAGKVWLQGIFFRIFLLSFLLLELFYNGEVLLRFRLGAIQNDSCLKSVLVWTGITSRAKGKRTLRSSFSYVVFFNYISLLFYVCCFYFISLLYYYYMLNFYFPLVLLLISNSLYIIYRRKEQIRRLSIAPFSMTE